jgi:hypothetical protein
MFPKGSSKTKQTASHKIFKKSVFFKKAEQSDTDCSDVDMSEKDESDVEYIEKFTDESNQVYMNFEVQDIKKGDFLLVKYDSKSAVRYFVGKVY